MTDEERIKWREIITTDSTLRTLLTEAVVKEDYELIRKDARYTNLFPPDKWDVIIRILSPPLTQAGSTSSSLTGKITDNDTKDPSPLNGTLDREDPLCLLCTNTRAMEVVLLVLRAIDFRCRNRQQQ